MSGRTAGELKNFILSKFSEKGYIKEKKYSRESKQKKVNKLPTELLNFLDKRGAAEFDRGVSNQLFEQCQVSEFEDVELVQFVESYTLAVQTLRKKIKRGEIEKKNLEEEYKEATGRKDQNGRVEPVEEGKMDLFVRVTRGKGFENVGVLGKVSPLVKVRVSGSSEYQSTRAMENQSNPYWDESFEFMGLNMKEAVFLEFKVFHQEKTKDDTLIGSKSIALREFGDQQRRELRLHLDDKDGDEIKVRKLR